MNKENMFLIMTLLICGDTICDKDKLYEKYFYMMRGSPVICLIFKQYGIARILFIYVKT